MTSKLEFLSQLPIFADLSQAALARLAAIAKEYTFREGAVIAYQRDVANSLYIVREGRLFSRAMDSNGVARETRSYLPGQYFNDTWLFLPGAHPATVKGAEAGRLLIIEGPDFIRFLEQNPAVIDELAPEEDWDGTHYGLSEAAWAEAQKLKIRAPVSRAPAQTVLPEERVEYFARRSWWFLLLELLLPAVIILGAFVIFAIMPTDTGLERALKYALPFLLLLFGTLLFLLRLIDWREDYFIITNRHLTHHEFDLRRFRIHLVKVPISQVQTVEILKPSFFANLFDIGTARVTTAAIAGNIVFDNIDDPILVKNILERLLSQYRTLESAQTQAAMRESIERHFGAEPQLNPAEDGEMVALGPAPRPVRLGFWRSFQRRYGWRVEEGVTITYRKSLFILLKQIALPLLGFILLGGLLYLLIYLSLTPWVIAAVAGLLFLANLVWFIWQVENWRNDIFQLTDRFVIDIDRLPFGFGESRKQAPISNIQNVDATRPGFLPTLFNYGFVNVETAGTDANIVFDYVPNPELIQTDIFQRLDDFRRQQRIREGSSRREEYALLLDVYRQAMEQNRIPQRTPIEMDESDE